jgi:hypothetical protein
MARLVLKEMAAAIVVILTMSLAPVSAEAEPRDDKGIEYIAMIIAPITGPYGANQKKELEDQDNLMRMYYIGEATCTNDMMLEDTLKDWDAAYRTLPVTFGKPGKPKDPIAEARKAVFGTPEFTNKVRRQMCQNLKLRNKYYATLRGLITKYGQQFKPQWAEPDQDAMRDIWESRISAYELVLKPWLAVDLNSLHGP